MNLRNSAELPFGLIASNKLGIPSISQSTNQTFGQANLDCAINLASGNLFFEDKAFSFLDIGAPINFSYVYNSNDQPGWRLAFGRQVKKIADIYLVTEANGCEVKYKFNAEDCCYYPEEYASSRPTLKLENGQLLWRDPELRETNIFSSDGLLAARLDAAGNKTIYEYQDGLLHAIVAPSGTRYEFRQSKDKLEVYLVRNGTYETILLHSYLFNDGKLINSTTKDQYQINYQYKDGLLEEVIQTDSSSLKFTYDQKKIQAIQVGSDVNNTHKITYQNNISIFEEAAGSKRVLTYDENKYPLTFTIDKDEYHYQFSNAGQLELISYPDKSMERFEHGSLTGLIKKHIARDGSYTEYQYSEGAKPLLISEILYDQNHVAHPIYYFYQSINNQSPILKFKVSSEGRITEYIANETNGLIEGERYYAGDFFPLVQTILNTEAISNWSKNVTPANIIHISYTHDDRGRVSSIQKNSEQALYRHDDNGNTIETKIKTDDDQYSQENKQFDALGRLTILVSGVNSPVEQNRTIQYAANQTQTTLPNGRKELVEYDDAGKIISEKISVKDSTETHVKTYQHYPKNRAVVTTDVDGKDSFQFYDEEQRLKAEVSTAGKVTFFDRNNAKRYLVTTEYAKPIDKNMLYIAPSYYGYYFQGKTAEPTFAQLKPALKGKENAADIRMEYTFFGFNNEIRYEIDADNYLMEHRYNGFGKPIHHIQYKEKVSQAELKLLSNGKELNRTPDRFVDIIDSNFYDLDGHLIATQDAAGYVTQQILDGIGKPQVKIVYDTSVNTFDDDFNNIKPTENLSKDARTYYFYKQGKLNFEVDAKGYVTLFTYYDDGKPKTTKRVENKIDLAWLQNPKDQPELPLGSENDLETCLEYDELRRLVTKKESDGAVTVYAYDEMDQQVSCHTRDLVQQENKTGDYFRGKENRFNDWGQTIAHSNQFVTSVLANTEDKTAIWQQNAERNSFTNAGLKLKSVDPLGYSTYYFYDQDKNPILTIDSTGIIFELERNGFSEIMSERKYYQRLPLAQLTKLQGGYADDKFLTTIHGLRHAKDSVTKITKRNKRGLIEEKQDAAGNIYRYEWDAFKRCIKEQLPVSSQNPTLTIEHEYEQRGLETKRIKSVDSQKIITRNAYQNAYGKQTDLYDAVGGHTQYCHDRLGNVETVRKLDESGNYIPVEQTTYDAFSRPLTTTNADNESIIYSYHEKDRTTTINPAGSTAKTVIKHNIYAEEISREEYENEKLLYQTTTSHAPSGQIASQRHGGDNPETTEYDLNGKVETMTDKNNTKTTFVRNMSGQLIAKVEENDNLKRQTIMEPNALDQDEVVINKRGFKTENEFDANGNLAKSTFAAGLNQSKPMTQFHHNTQGEITDLIKGDEKNSNQYHEQYQRDGFGRLQAKIIDPESLSLTTAFEYDVLDNVIEVTSPKGYITRNYYNTLQQKRFEIKDRNTSSASATEYNYTSAGKLRTVRNYALPLSKEGLPKELAKIREFIVPSNQDAIVHYFYDDQGREQYKLTLIYSHEKKKFEAKVEEKTYAGLKQEIITRCYANLIDAEDVEKLSTDAISKRVAEIADPTRDRIQYQWYKYSRECLTANQDGIAIEKQFNAAGKLTKQVEHYNRLSHPETLLKQTVDEVLTQLPSHEKDLISHFVYDELGRLTFKVLPNRAVIKQTYDENDNIIEICEFKEPFNVPSSYEEMVIALKALVPVFGKDQITKKAYDVNDQVKAITDALGNKDTFERDALGNVKTHIDRANQEWRYQYDRGQRLTHEISPLTSITHVMKQEGKLQSYDIQTTVTKKTEFDEDNNAVKILDGMVDEELAIKSNPSIKDNLPEARAFNAIYEAEQRLIGTEVPNVNVDNGSDYSRAWDDLAALPEKKENIITRTIHDSMGRKIAEQNQNGKWSFYIRDNLGRIVFEIKDEKTVTEKKYNAFNEVEEERRYSEPCIFDVSEFVESGITLAQITHVQTEDQSQIYFQKSNEDRLIKLTYNRAGKVELIQSAEVAFYSEGIFGKANPEAINRYNSFGHQLYEAKLIRPGVWAEKYIWPDAFGNPLAEVNENKGLTIFERDIAGKEISRIEFEKEFPNPDAIQSVEELKKQAKRSPKDRKYVSKYDALGQKIAETLLVRDGEGEDFINPITQKLVTKNVNGKEIVELEQHSDALTKHWSYTATQKLNSTTHEDGSTEYKYYDSRGMLIGETEVSRRANLKNDYVTPFSQYRLNAFGQTAMSENSQEGCESPTSDQLPVFKKPEQTSKNTFLHDSRGLVSYKSDPIGNLTAYTYSPSRKLVRQLQPVSQWQQIPSSSTLTEDWIELEKEHRTHHLSAALTTTYKQQTHIDEKRIEYDEYDRPAGVSYLREGRQEQRLISKYNQFNEVIAEGENGEDWPVYHKFDASGREWSSNSEDGSNAILLYDLRGAHTLKLQAANDKLHEATYDDISNILSWGSPRVEYTENMVDVSGRLIAKKNPYLV